MTGPQHYAEAERLIDGPEPGISDYEEMRRDNLSEALIHATLALAAATIEAATGSARPGSLTTANPWTKAFAS
jgi:hypothetical protein